MTTSNSGLPIVAMLTLAALVSSCGAEFALAIPTDARSVELWFNTIGRDCGSHWDSKSGNNHRFSIDNASR